MMRRKAERVQLDNLTLESPQYFIETLDTLNLTKKTKKAQFEIKNIKGRDTRVFGISLVPDSTFRRLGFIEVWLNEVRLLPANPTKAIGKLSNIDSLNVPIPQNFGLKILPDKKLEFFVYSFVGVTSKLNVTAFTGDILQRK